MRHDRPPAAGATLAVMASAPVASVLRRSPARVSALALLALALGAGGCREPGPEAPPPNVLVLVLDTLRADRLGVYGNERGLTPFLDGLAGRGAVFANAYAASSWTVPSVASLFTSRYPSQHRVVDFESVLADREITLAERLAAHGWATAGFTANFRLSEEFGYAQGFDTWQPLLLLSGRSVVPGDLKARAGLVVDKALAWLDARGSQDPAPVLLYLHFLEPHPPYLPPEPQRGRFAGAAPPGRDRVGQPEADGSRRRRSRGAHRRRGVALLAALYDGEVAALDAALAGLFDALRRRRFLDDALVVVTSDHGEEFREHDDLLHGLTLFEESIRVPLIVLASGVAAGTVVQPPVSLVDVAPTLLDLLGLPAEPGFEGRSRAPLLRGAVTSEADDIVAELIDESARRERRHRAALIRETQKLVVDQAGRSHAYDLARDPAERDPQTESGSTRADLGTGARAAPRRPRAPRQRRGRDAAARRGDPREPARAGLRGGLTAAASSGVCGASPRCPRGRSSTPPGRMHDESDSSADRLGYDPGSVMRATRTSSAA